MIKIANNDKNIGTRNGKFKNIYIILFTSGVLLLFIGILLISVASFIPKPEYTSPEYQVYLDIIEIIANIRRLFVNTGLLIIIQGLFLGASTIENLSDNAQRGMFIAIGLIIIGFIFNLAFTGVFGY